MLENIDINRMNRLMQENSEAKSIITQLIKNHHTDVSMIAHEIRNPLTLVSSSLQVIEAQHPEVKEFYNWKQTMEDIQFMCSLLNELTTFNNSSTLHYSVFPIGGLLKNIAISFAISLDSEDSEIRFSSRISPELGEFTGDKVKLEEVVLNLLRNAKDAVKDDGVITLSADKENSQIVIRCTDNGCGIPDDETDRIFDPFFLSQRGRNRAWPVPFQKNCRGTQRYHLCFFLTRIGNRFHRNSSRMNRMFCLAGTG